MVGFWGRDGPSVLRALPVPEGSGRTASPRLRLTRALLVGVAKPAVGSHRAECSQGRPRGGGKSGERQTGGVSDGRVLVTITKIDRATHIAVPSADQWVVRSMPIWRP